VLCRDLDISRSAYYQWTAEAASRRERARSRELLVAQITLVWLGSRCSYGAPRVHAELRRRGNAVSRKRIERLMREHGIAGHTCAARLYESSVCTAVTCRSYAAT